MNTAPLNIAIIGSGMAGLTAAYVLGQHGHRVSIFESQAKNGLAAHSTAFGGGMIDAPLRVMNPQLWSHTLALAAHVGLNLYRVRTDMACSWIEHSHIGATWFSSRRHPRVNFPLLGNWRHMAAVPQLAWGISQLKQALARVHELDDDISLHTWLQRHPMPNLLWQGCVVPVLLTVCTCDVVTLLQWPARPLLHFVDLLLQDAGLYRLHGGTQALASALQQDTLLHNHHAVTAVYQQAQQVWVRDANEQSHSFDHVIVATPTQACGFLDEAQYATEKRLLLQLPYSRGDLVSHTDASAMPQHRRDWSPLHYSMSHDFQDHSFSVWLNPIEASLDNDATPVFQTWNSLTALQEHTIVQHTRLTRSVCTVDSLRSVQALQDLQAASSNTRRLWLCGSWSCDGLPVLESAVTSALSVCQHLGANLNLRLGSAQVVTVSP